jgi:hypothetical protein
MGDAAGAFAAAAMAVGATGGKDHGPLTSLCRKGVASRAGDGGFPIIEREVQRVLAPGPVKDACLRCVLYKSFSPTARFQHLIASPFN